MEREAHWQVCFSCCLWKVDGSMVVYCIRSRWLCWELGEVSSSKKLKQTLSFWCAIYFEKCPIYLDAQLHMPGSSVIPGLFKWKQCQLLPHSFSQDTDHRLGSLGYAAGVELILGFTSSHWHLVLWEGSKLVPNSKFSLLHSQNSVSQAEAQLWADVFSLANL